MVDQIDLCFKLLLDMAMYEENNIGAGFTICMLLACSFQPPNQEVPVCQLGSDKLVTCMQTLYKTQCKKELKTSAQQNNTVMLHLFTG